MKEKVFLKNSKNVTKCINNNREIKVLIIDNDHDAIFLIRNLLEDTKIQLELYETTLNSAIEFLEKEKFDCILINLPDSLGIDTIKNISSKFPELPVIVLMEIDNEDISIKYLREGVQDYLVKSKINVEIVTRSIRYAIERKKIENALRESEKKYKNIVDTSLEGLWIIDKDARTTYVNKQLVKMLGYAEDEMLDQLFFNFVCKDFRNDAIKFFERRQRGIKDRYDFCFAKKDGSILWVTVSASPIFDEIGKFVGAIGMVTDITERKLMEQSLERSIGEWNSTFNAITDTICIVDIDGKITHCNNAAATLFKKACKELVGKRCWDILTCPPERLKNCPIIKMKRSNKRESLTVQVNDKWYFSAVDPILDNKGNIIGAVHIISDITKYKLYQDKLKESELALKKSQQIGHIGHWSWDIKTNKLSWSDEMFRIFDISRNEFDDAQADLDKIIEKSIPPDDREKIRNINEGIKLLGHTPPIEYRTIWRDGTVHTIWGDVGEKFTNKYGDVTKLFGIAQDITERKEIEQKLIKSQKMLADAQRVTHVGSWEWDLLTRTITWSKETFHLFGLEPSQSAPTYEEHLKYYHPEDRPNFERIIENTIKTGAPFSVVCRVILPDNSIRYLEGKGETVCDDKGNVIKVFGTSMDITDHKIAEQQITNLKNFYENILDGFINGVFVTDSNDKIFYCNKGMVNISGVSKDEILNKYLFKDFPEKALRNFKPLYVESKENLKHLFYESILVHTASGRKSYQSGWLIPLIRDKQFDGMICTIDDVTEQKAVQDKLKESEELYRTITEYSNDMIWTLDSDGNITFINKRSEQMSGYKLNELKGKYFSFLLFGQDTFPKQDSLPKQDVLPNALPKQDVLPNALPKQDTFPKQDINKILEAFHSTLIGSSQQYEVTLINKDKKYITLAVNAAPIYSKGKIIGIINSGRDVTETVKIAKALKNLTEKLQESNKELEQFAYIASHDLQEPLRSISSFTELLARRYRGRFDPDADKFIDHILTGTKRMQQMINDLLALSRIGTRGKEFTSTSITNVINDVFKNLHSLIERSNAVITTDSKMPIVHADSTQLIQLFQNLIDNAIKFRKAEPPTIHISARQENGEWIFSVKDNGIGISEKDFNKLFKAFSRLHSREKYPGTGIGLVICKRIVERHKGKIWLESKPGIGTTFYFTIPTQDSIPTQNNK